MKTAVLVIDMQNDFINPSSPLTVKGITKKLPKLKTFIASCRQKGLPIIYTRHIYDKINPMERLLFPKIFSKVLQRGSRGSAIHDSIKPTKADMIISKERYDAFLDTNLEKALKERKIKNLIIVGTMTEVCCDTTARSAMMRDFKVVFCSDLTFTKDPQLQKSTIQTMNNNFASVLSSNQILKMI